MLDRVILGFRMMIHFSKLHNYVMKNDLVCSQALRQELEKKGWASQDTI